MKANPEGTPSSECSFNDYVGSIDQIVEQLKSLMDTAYVQYSACVGAIVRNELTDIVQIERIMDGLCDFGDDERFLDLYKKLCRHIYRQYPQLVGEHINWVWRQIRAEVEAEDAGCPEMPDGHKAENAAQMCLGGPI